MRCNVIPLSTGRGKTPINKIAEASGFNRYQVSRWLAGTAQPKLIEFLCLVQVCSRRLLDLLALCVDVTRLPSAARTYAQHVAARTVLNCSIGDARTTLWKCRSGASARSSIGVVFERLKETDVSPYSSFTNPCDCASLGRTRSNHLYLWRSFVIFLGPSPFVSLRVPRYFLPLAVPTVTRSTIRRNGARVLQPMTVVIKIAPRFRAVWCPNTSSACKSAS
jgi:hypothetical protein